MSNSAKPKRTLSAIAGYLRRRGSSRRAYARRTFHGELGPQLQVAFDEEEKAMKVAADILAWAAQPACAALLPKSLADQINALSSAAPEKDPRQLDMFPDTESAAP